MAEIDNHKKAAGHLKPSIQQPTRTDEFKSLGQASSELIAKLGKRAKVGARDEAQPPSKITQHVGGETNVIYLNSKDVKKRPPNKSNQSNKTDNLDNVIFLFW